MPFYFLVAFGHGQGASPTMPPAKASEALRFLIDDACDASFGSFPDDVKTSVAPGGVMLAFPDAEPMRPLYLCTAVQSQLQHAVRTRDTVIPVCAVLTGGELREVNVLGYSSNFEGPPAIAAARILAKLPTGLFAVEQTVWDFRLLGRHLGEPETLAGKHRGEEFSIRVHRQITFPDLRNRLESTTI
jgi:hypothetical protein